MANTPQPPTPSDRPPDPELLAAVVLDTLVARGRDGMTLAAVATACERDPANVAEACEVEVALEILRADDLASLHDERWRPTRAAIRAAELSF